MEWYDAWRDDGNLSVVWGVTNSPYRILDMATLCGRNTVANDEIITTWEFERLVAAKTSEATGPIVSMFEHLQVDC
jgi:hypothetical protein